MLNLDFSQMNAKPAIFRAATDSRFLRNVNTSILNTYQKTNELIEI